MSEPQKSRLVFLVPTTTSQLHPDKEFKSLANQLSLKFSVSTTNSLQTTSPDEIIFLAADLDYLSEQDCQQLQEHRQAGGSIFVAFSYNQKPSEELLSFMKQTGLNQIKSLVIQSAYTPGLYHPTHVRLTYSSFVNQALATKIEKLKQSDEGQSQETSFLYPAGSYFYLLTPPAYYILSTGEGAFPVRQPILYANEIKGAANTSHMLVFGSSAALMNDSIKRYDNRWFVDVLLSYLIYEEDCIYFCYNYQLNYTEDDVHVPDTKILSQNYKACLHCPDPLPDDFRELIEIDDQPQSSLLNQVVELYEYFNLPKNEPILKLIKPSFERPTPPLVPATHAPSLPEPPGIPQLELYDLDSELSSNATRLGRLALKCKSEDLEQFIEGCGDIFGIRGNAKEILYAVLKKSVDFKKSYVRGQ